MATKYEEALNLVGDATDFKRWVLVPYPIESLKNKPAEFERAVLGALVDLVHETWHTVPDAVRELSDTGGVEFVRVFHVKRVVHISSEWSDGKQLMVKP